MFYEFNCTECGKRLRIRAELAGTLTKCPHCETTQIAKEPLQADEVIPVAQIASSNPFAEVQTKENPYRDAPITAPATRLPSSRTSRPRISDQFTLAAPGARFVALAVDLLAILFACTPGFILTNLLDGIAPGVADLLGSGLTWLGFLGLQAFQWFNIATTGQSLGKRLLKIRIADAGGSPPGFVVGVLVRTGLSSMIWSFASLFVLMCFPIGIILVIAELNLLFSDRRQCTHDLLASTFVVQADKSTD